MMLVANSGEIWAMGFGAVGGTAVRHWSNTHLAVHMDGIAVAVMCIALALVKRAAHTYRPGFVASLGGCLNRQLREGQLSSEEMQSRADDFLDGSRSFDAKIESIPEGTLKRTLLDGGFHTVGIVVGGTACVLLFAWIPWPRSAWLVPLAVAVCLASAAAICPEPVRATRPSEGAAVAVAIGRARSGSSGRQV